MMKEHCRFAARGPFRLALGLVVLALAGCGSGADGSGGPGGPGGPGGAGGPGGGPGGMPGGGVPQVGVITVEPTQVPITTELSGRTAAWQTSEVRPQVSGIIRKRYFTEGSNVKAGDKLYQIDPSLYEATVAQARANLASAQASAEAARMLAERYRPLAELQAVSQQDLTDAEAQAGQAQAAVAQMRAALQTAEINLRYTDITAPISGRIGRSLFTVGALVTANQADALAVIQTLDPIFVDIQQSSGELLGLRSALARDGGVPTRAEVKLSLEDGSVYGERGTVEFAEAVVNESTGTVTLRARLPNPQELLLPGMFVRAQFAAAVDAQAYLVPQAAVVRDAQGNASVWIVDGEDKAQQRPITAERTSGSDWVVSSGLAAGDRVIVEGTSKVRVGQGVQPMPADGAQYATGSQDSTQGATAARATAAAKGS